MELNIIINFIQTLIQPNNAIMSVTHLIRVEGSFDTLTPPSHTLLLQSSIAPGDTRGGAGGRREGRE